MKSACFFHPGTYAAEGQGKLSVLLEVKNLRTNFYIDAGVAHAVNGVEFTIDRGKTLGVVGESGCGKSVTALSIMGLIRPPGKMETGEILFHKDGSAIDLSKLEPMGPEMRSIRGNEIAMIFQEPMTSLNPVYTIGTQIMESIILHQRLSRNDARDKAVEMLESVGIPSPEMRIKEYPHQLSGGMRQRVMIAMAMVCRPSLLIADEPTTALDVSTQAQILTLIEKLKAEFKMSVLFITHDLGIIAQTAKHVVVMYAGQVVETAPVLNIFDRPAHPYTRGLLRSIPRMGTSTDGPKKRLQEIKGSLPSQDEPIPGCRFADRCPDVFEPCRQKRPDLLSVRSRQQARCWLYAAHGSDALSDKL